MAIISGLLGAATSLIGSYQQSENIDKQIAAQQEENRKNREYNLMLANLQNEWNVEQWERENEYNDPSAQMSRYVKAGLNPDLIYGQGANSISARSPELTSGAPSSPVDMSALGQKPTIGQAATMALQNMATAAQARKTIAESEKTVEETEGQRSTNKILASDAAFRDALNKGQLDLQGLQIDLTYSQRNLTDEQVNKTREETKQIQQTVSKLQAEINALGAQIELMDAQRLREIMSSKVMAETLAPTIAKLQAEAGLSRAQAKRILEMLPYDIVNARMAGQDFALEIEGKSVRNGMLYLSKESAKIQLDLARDFAEAEKILQLLGSATQSLSEAFSTFGQLKGKKHF